MNVGWTVSDHYCGGELAKSVFAVGHADVGCGMESDKDMSPCEKRSNENSFSEKECCQNEYTIISVEDDYNKTSIQEVVVDFTFVTAFVATYINLYSINNDNSQEYVAYSPPILNPDAQVMFQSFLI